MLRGNCFPHADVKKCSGFFTPGPIMIMSIMKHKQCNRLIYLVHHEILPALTGLSPQPHTTSRQSFAPTSELVLRAGVMAMTETASIEITQPTSLVEGRRIDPIIG